MGRWEDGEKMKRAASWLIILGLFISGCIYKVPFVAEHTIPIDPAVLGLWEFNERGEKPDRMMVLKFSDTEYLVHYPFSVEDGGMYFRAYPIKLGGITAIQIQWIGTAEGDVANEERKYQLIAYTLINGELEIRPLNNDLVNKDLTTSEELRQAFLKNKDNKELFYNPGRFKKVVPKS
jgi:hypothetical protein